MLELQSFCRSIGAVMHREDVLDLRRHADAGLADALALGLKTLPTRSDRGLMIRLGARTHLSVGVVRQLIDARVQLGQDGRRCAIVMPAAAAVSTALAYRTTIPSVASPHEARQLLTRAQPKIRVRRHDAGRALRATISGALDLAGLRAVSTELDAIIAFARPDRSIVLDLGTLEFADPHGLEAITRVAVRAQLAGARLRVVDASAQVRALAFRLDWHRQLPGLGSPASSIGADVRPARTAVIATDLRGAVMYWDELAHSLYGWAASEALGRDITELTVGPDAERLAGAIMSEVRDRGAWEGQFPVRRRDAPPFNAHVRNATIDDGLGAPVAVVGYSTRAPE
ncbi:PAS domain-containing protein [Solirubrobacter taibaiensis]|nr:PAS domain-containing protein [Solirubrobacter taibaiensis]